MTSQSVPHNSTYDALCAAIDDEFKARATYRAVIAALGPVRPFVHIVEAEQRHIDALVRQFHRFGWQPPGDRWHDKVAAPASLAEACKLGMEAEVDNVSLYERLSAMTDDAKIAALFTRLRRASAENHFPAFERCLTAERGSSTRCGPAARHAGGRGRAGFGSGPKA